MAQRDELEDTVAKLVDELRLVKISLSQANCLNDQLLPVDEARVILATVCSWPEAITSAVSVPKVRVCG